MTKDLEAELERRIRSGVYKFPREAIEAMVQEKLINSPKQAWRTLEKWIKQGRYDYGVCFDLGFMVDKDKP